MTIVRVHNRHAPILSNLRLGTVLSLYDSAAGRVFLAYREREMIQSVLEFELSRMEEPKPSP